MSSLFYFFKESVTGFARNLSTTVGSIITIFLSLLIIGIFLIGGVILDNAMSSVEDKVTITAFIGDEASEDEIGAVMDTIESIKGVESLSFTSKEQALENFKASSSSTEIIEQLDGLNPLPASIEVTLDDAQYVDSVAKAIAEDSGFQSICDNEENPTDSVRYGQETVEKLLSLTNYARIIGLALIALLIVIALIFINNTIRLSILARRKEIAIMRLVGASNGFIRGPFLMESALHASIGAILAIGCMEAIRRVGLPVLSSNLAWLPIAIPLRTYAVFYIALFVAGLVIAAIGSAFAMRRYLKV